MTGTGVMAWEAVYEVIEAARIKVALINLFDIRQDQTRKTASCSLL